MYDEDDLQGITIPPEFMTLQRRLAFIAESAGVTTEQAQQVLDAKSQYEAHFYYKCDAMRCPSLDAIRKQAGPKYSSGRFKTCFPGFATKAELEWHRENEHVNHGQANWHDNWTGSVTWYYCSCGHQDNRYNFPDDPRYRKDRYPATRIAHLRRVLCANPNAQLADEDWKHL